MATLTGGHEALARDSDAVWHNRLRRLRSLARSELRRLGLSSRKIDLDDVVQEAALAWIVSGVVRQEFISDAAVRALGAAIARAITPPSRRSLREEDASLPSHLADARLEFDDEEDLLTAIAALPPRHRLLAEARLAGARPLPTYVELADRCGCSHKNVWVMSRRAASIVLQKVKHLRAVRTADALRSRLVTARHGSRRAMTSRPRAS